MPLSPDDVENAGIKPSRCLFSSVIGCYVMPVLDQGWTSTDCSNGTGSDISLLLMESRRQCLVA